MAKTKPTAPDAAIETAAPEAQTAPHAAEQLPPGGGRYLRQPDGSLVPAPQDTPAANPTQPE